MSDSKDVQDARRWKGLELSDALGVARYTLGWPDLLDRVRYLRKRAAELEAGDAEQVRIIQALENELSETPRGSR